LLSAGTFENVPIAQKHTRSFIAVTTDVETMIVGAGVVGLAIARSLAIAGHEVMVAERHGLVGSETSSRNSEVIHAGIYYPKNSLRARYCVEGKQKLYEFCHENGVDHARCEKLIVAANDDQLERLDAIKATAAANGVDDLVRLTGAEAMRLEPAVFCTGALLSPSTGLVDSHGFMVALEGHAEAHGGQVALQTDITSIEARKDGTYALTIAGTDVITAKNVVISGGLHASTLAETIQFNSNYRPPQTYYAVGQYYALSGPSPFNRHIYPMPDGAWLGLHATVDLGHRCKFGPDIEWIPEIDYTFKPEKLAKFLDFIRMYYPGLDESRLHPDYTGIRPKLYREDEAVPDFRVDTQAQHGHPGLVMLFGIESPGLTAALAIGDAVARIYGQGE
jgi:L-2-hydroxyglutarate oxidase LhgO